jgi:hypothetical protein
MPSHRWGSRARSTYRTEQLLDALGRLEGVYQVEWQH